jgi:hypothetical protein
MFPSFEIKAMVIDHLPPAVSLEVGAAERAAMAARFEAERAILEARIETAMALARERESEPALKPALSRRRPHRPPLKYVIKQAKGGGAASVDVPGGYRVNLTGGSNDDAPGAPDGNPWDVVLPGAKDGAR